MSDLLNKNTSKYKPIKTLEDWNKIIGINILEFDTKDIDMSEIIRGVTILSFKYKNEYFSYSLEDFYNIYG